MKLPVVTLGLLLLASTIAHAEPDAGDRTRDSHVSATIGLGTPTGMVGVEYTLVALPNLEVGFGVGLGNLFGSIMEDAGKPDPQGAIMPRFRARLGPGTVTLGAGISGGPYTVLASPFEGGDLIEQANALWVNGEAGYEYVATSRAFMRFYVGYGKVIAHTTGEDRMGNELSTPSSLDDEAFPYLGLSFGYAF